MNNFMEIGLDDDFSLDLSDIFTEEQLSQQAVDLESVPVLPISLTYAGKQYMMYTTDSVGIAQIFNDKDTLDELSVDKLYLLPEGKEIRNKELLSKFELLPEQFVSEQLVKESRVEEFSNRFLRNHLIYVYKKKVY